ncbi:hypothetical protein [Micromonospora endolithica]|uniref:Uncharacterized protein n=1 Tax=Micromonospora endolithica TaxID=230091 RepID=A0A3A9ZRE7_9ACTN|nr:hypothetical protein [Micromonospora endolithica]RKN50731.1 hypothetical protein D7223_02925 [Micromonospora endolithica]TWJ20527.1 hypothetical protein JD76_00625 [Micromonospora endolithica]
MTADGGVLDGFRIGYLPDGVGAEVSDFASEWEEVRFATRVWERQVPDGYRVDLRVHVLRGERLADLAALRDFLAGYHEGAPEGWLLNDFVHGEVAGLHDNAQAFWLVEPGVGVNVLVEPEMLDGAALLSIASAVVPEHG